MAYLDADESFNEGASSDALLGGDSQGRLRLDRGLFSDEKGSRCHSRDASTGACRRARDFGLALAVGVVLGSLLTGTSLWLLRRVHQHEEGICHHGQDPYAQPGYLMHDDHRATWVPYSDPVENFQITEGRWSLIAGQRHNGTVLPGAEPSHAPPSYASLLRARSSAQTTLDALEVFRNKRVLIVGCSLDRNFLQSFCETHGGKQSHIWGDWRGAFACDIEDLSLQIQMWFTFGALPDYDELEGGSPRQFERRVGEFLRPKVREAGFQEDHFDLILWSSGTWDILGVRKKSRDAAGQNWKEQSITWEELEWHRGRLLQMTEFLRTQWPDATLMYRPPTYTYKRDLPAHNPFLEGVLEPEIDYINKSVFRMIQSAESLAREGSIDTFRWSEKLVGSNQYADSVHYAPGTAPQWLYGEMMLYYLRRRALLAA